MQLVQLAGEVQSVNPGVGKLVIAIIIILALWGQKGGSRDE